MQALTISAPYQGRAGKSGLFNGGARISVLLFKKMLLIRLFPALNMLSSLYAPNLQS
jgi:hypothetical protein